MFDWEWECFEDLVNNGTFTITDIGPLRAPIRTFVVSRDDKLRLVLETKADQNASSNVPDHPLGTVRNNSDTVTFSGMMGSIVAHGVQPGSYSTVLSANPAEREFREVSRIHTLEGSLSSSGKQVTCVIDWLTNVNNSFVWPHFSEDDADNTKTRRLHDGVNGINIKSSSNRGDRSRNCVRFAVDGHQIYLATCKPSQAKKLTDPGFILYEGNTSKEFRKKILDCVSYALGVYLVRLGSSSFDEDWNMVSFDAVSAYALGGKAFEHGALPPAPLGFKYRFEIDPPHLVRMVSSLYKAYDSLRLGSLCWAYWHAVCATPHIAAVHFGAAIEALQASYLGANKGVIKTTLLEKDSWAVLSGIIGSAIAQLTEDEETLNVFRNKMGDFNNPPLGVVTDRLLEVLHLHLGEREKNAWKRRNDAGHGNEVHPEGYVELIMDIKLLQLRFNKMVLAMTGASDLFNDHFTIDHPIRKLGDPVT
jgi:hypothetical protein